MFLSSALGLGPGGFKAQVDDVLNGVVDVRHQRDARESDHRGKPARSLAGREVLRRAVGGVHNLRAEGRGG